MELIIDQEQQHLYSHPPAFFGANCITSHEIAQIFLLKLWVGEIKRLYHVTKLPAPQCPIAKNLIQVVSTKAR